MADIQEIELVQVDFSGTVRPDDKYDSSTADLNAYLMRVSCIQSEYDAGIRMWDLRKVALELINDLRALGVEPSEAQMRIIDVDIMETVTKRVSLNDR